MDSVKIKKGLQGLLICVACSSFSVFSAVSLSLDNEDLPPQFASGINGTNSSYQLKAIKQVILPNGKVKYKYQQYYKNIPVLDVNLVKDINTKFQGSLLINIEQDLDAVNPAISKDQVIEIIKKQYKVDNTANLIDANIKLFIKNINNIATLIYKIDFILEQPKLSRPNLMVDANSGEILEQWDGLTSLEYIDATGPGGNEKTGKYEYGKDYGALKVSKVDNKCTMTTEKVKTYDKNHSDDADVTALQPFNFDCNENTYKKINGGFSPINDAHYFGNVVFQMYKDWFNKAPLKSELQLFVHYGEDVANAYWTGSKMLFGDGDKKYYPFVSLDVIAHEVSHGFTEQNSNLKYRGQAGGLNESFSDIAGEAAKYYFNKDKPEGERNDWMVGANIFKGEKTQALRYFKEPTKDGKSIDNAKDYNFFMDPHYSSGVFNKAFYNLATTKDWDVPKAFKVFVTANEVYWGVNTNYDEGACGVTKAAKDLNLNTDDVKAAFENVGVNAVCPEKKDDSKEQPKKKRKPRKKKEFDDEVDFA